MEICELNRLFCCQRSPLVISGYISATCNISLQKENSLSNWFVPSWFQIVQCWVYDINFGRDCVQLEWSLRSPHCRLE